MSKYDVKIKNLEGGEIEIEAKIEWSDVEKHRPVILKKYSQNMKLDGFREGHVPENVVIQKVGEENINSDMAEKALQMAYPEIVKENNLNVIGAPKITVTKMAKDNPLEFKVNTITMPEVKIPDYKTIAKEVNSKTNDIDREITIEDKEVEDAIKHLREQWARSEKVQDMANKEGKKLEEIDPRTIEIKDEDLPKFDDDFVKKVGAFENVNDFKTKLRANMLKEKTMRAKEKRRAEILEKIATQTEVSVPNIVVDGELDRMLAQFQGDVVRTGMKFEDYLKQANKSEKDLRAQWRPDAEKYSKNQMIMNKIIVEENIVPDKKLVDTEVEKIMTSHKDADRNRAQIYVETLMTNDLVFEFLENQN